MNAAKLLKIDKDALDDELVKQPGMFLRVAEEYARAVSARDGLKEAVDVVRAKSELDVRRRLEEDGAKVTESIVKATLELEKSYRRAVDAFLAAKEVADLAAAAKDAFAQRAYVLKDLCSLYVAGYFSTSAVKGPDAREVDEEGYQERRRMLAKQRRRLN